MKPTKDDVLTVVAAAVEFPTQSYSKAVCSRIEAHKARADHCEAVLHHSCRISISAKDAITAISICDICKFHVICAVLKLV